MIFYDRYTGSKKCDLQDINFIAQKVGFDDKNVVNYGRYKAKVSVDKFNCKGKLILDTAMNPTPLIECKTTVASGLTDALDTRGKKLWRP